MPSKFATELLEKIDQGDGMLTALETMEYEDLIDAELQEVRESIDHLLKIVKDAKLPSCPACKQAEQVTARLRVDGGKGE